ncbi:hypothetical protein RCC89_20790 [Cytophagaceae bacterium ABcell3]|nr:hypothetical protein RCC89_20775 [Cytophagaceae bacterium ABcell3]WMJ75577.1 hypothetical protein RCC89_20790 [Cytophagaceae bacterium ABcell3]
MKKLTTLALGVLFASAVLSSCKKDQNCVCEVDGETIYNEPIEGNDKAWCDSQSDPDHGVHCELK